MRRIILTTGGTGGHIFPALAVADELRQAFPEIRILFIGGESGPEKRLATQAGLEFMSLPVRGFFGRGLKAVGAGFRLLRGISQARRKIKEFKPDMVIGFGGYAAAAALAAGCLAGVPTMIHEQNSVPGIANRLLGRFVDKVCISLPDAEKWFKPGKTVLTGNPVRRAIRELYQSKMQDKMHQANLHHDGYACAPVRRNLLVLGGSQGAKAINSAILADLPALRKAGVNVRIQAGAADYERTAVEVANYLQTETKVPESAEVAGTAKLTAAVKAADSAKAENIAEVTEATDAAKATDAIATAQPVRVSAFIDDMREAYAWADLALCRAGATTVAELAAAGLPAIFIPFPFATHNHQLHNAAQVQKVGAAQVLEQKDITPGCLCELVTALFAEPAKLASMSDAALLLASPDAAEKVLREARKILSNSKSQQEAGA